MNRPQLVSFRWLKMFSGLMLLALALAACGGSPPATIQPTQPAAAPDAPAATAAPAPTAVPPPPTSTPAPVATPVAQPAQSGKLVFAGNEEPDSIDAIDVVSVNAIEVVAQMFETLVYIDQKQQIYPGLATEWERSPDAKVWTFKLVQNAKWHDGTPFNAQSVVDHFEYIRTSDDIKGSISSGLKPILNKTEKIDDFTVKITLNAARPDFLVDLAEPAAGIDNIANKKKLGQDAGFNPIGTGPFKFKEWIRGSQITLVPNPDWTWGSPIFGASGPPKVEELVFRFVPEAQTRLATLESGESHFIDLLPFQEMTRLRQDTRFTVSGFLLPGMPQMNYFNTTLPPTDDINVRKAIIFATDKKSIISSVYFDLVEPAYGPLSRAFPEYDPAIEKLYSYDPEKAKQLLDEAGWAPGTDGVRVKDGKRLEVTIVENKSWNDWVYLLQANLQEVGFDAKVLTTQGPSNTEAISSGKYQVPAMGDVFTAASQMTRDWESKGYGTFPSGHFWPDKALDTMLYDAQSELDQAKRKEKYSKIQFYIMENALMVPIFELYFYAAHAKNLKGFVVDGSGFYKWFAGAYFE